MILKSLLAVTTMVLALALAPMASAEQPDKFPVPLPDVTGQFCADFPVLVHATTNREVIHIFSNGAATITGALKAEVTNLETGKTIEVNIPGPGTFVADGSVLLGRGAWLFFGEAGDFGPGSPPELSYRAGRFTIDLATGAIISSIGQQVDLCPLLAS